ncbi:MAG: class A beta-lactamase-related serine hydrolase [Acidobacteriota bacterium]|nr:class A beta-lactamase-related serine hydrolase [Acidobacteriota bacterium]
MWLPNVRALSTLALFFFATGIPAQTALDQRLKARIAGFQGTVSVYAKNLDTGATVGIHEADLVRTASTIKLPILLTVFDAVERGKAKWTERLTVVQSEKVSGTGVLASEFSNGVQLPLRDLVNLMIVLSDNTATNMILERFSADAVNAYLDRIGIEKTRSLRKILSGELAAGLSDAGKLPANKKYGLGVTCPRDMVTILEKLERGELVSPEASKEMIAILKRCQDAAGIRRRVGNMPVANKTGALEALRSDVGIVYSPGGRIAMAITVDGMPTADWTPDNPGLLLIADLARLLVEGLGKKTSIE